MASDQCTFLLNVSLFKTFQFGTSAYIELSEIDLSKDLLSRGKRLTKELLVANLPPQNNSNVYSRIGVVGFRRHESEKFSAVVQFDTEERAKDAFWRLQWVLKHLVCVID